MLMLLIKDARTLRKSRGGGKKHAEKKTTKKNRRKKNSEVWEKYKKFPDGTEG